MRLVGITLLATGLVLGGATACAGTTDSVATSPAQELRLGFFPNITHATALVGVEKGFFQDALGPGTRLSTSTFNAGPAASEALFSGAIDASYIGPNPAITAFIKSHGTAIRVISGAASGGASLVVRNGISGPADLRGKKIADPQLAGTQDIALRWWLKSNGLKTDTEGGGDVSILPQDNSQTLTTFRAGQVDGAWVPEPWASRLVSEGGGKVLVDERSLWPGGQFVTTQLVVRAEFLRIHPETVRRLLEGQVRANAFVRDHPAEAQASANTELGNITGKKLSDAVVAASWSKLTFTDDPLLATLRSQADHAVGLGLQAKANLDGIADLTLLNQVLSAQGEPSVSAK